MHEKDIRIILFYYPNIANNVYKSEYILFKIIYLYIYIYSINFSLKNKQGDRFGLSSVF